MKRSTAPWSTALAAATLLSLPATGLAQTPPASPSPSKAASEQVNAPDEHLGKARAALDSIDSSALTGRAKSQVAELKRHLSALEHQATATSSTAATRGSKTASAAGATWATDVAAIDKIIAGLVGDDATAVGTSGAAKSKAEATVAIDDATRTKLMDVRRAITAYAASKSGTEPAPSSEPTPPQPANPPAASSTPPPPATTPTTPPPPTTGEQPPASAAQPATTPAVDQDAARRSLLEARDTLSQLTQLPAAAQLTGETRTQVSQLINNFNELITSQTDWRGAYAKVQANMVALLGPETSVDEPSKPTPTGTAGAVGTSGAGASTMDPAIKAKLIELRAKLNVFEKAAGGSAVTSTPPPSAPTPPTDPTASSATPPSPTPPSATPPSATPPSATPTSAEPEPQKPASAQAAMSHDEAMRHIQAIEAILSGNSPTATSGTTPPSAAPSTATAAPVTLTAAQVTELKSHLAELKKLVAQAPKK